MSRPYSDLACEERGEMPCCVSVPTGGTVPWSVHESAWEGYSAAGHGSQSAEMMAARGGFSYLEIQYALAGRFNDLMYPDRRTDYAMPPVPGWEPKRR